MFSTFFYPQSKNSECFEIIGDIFLAYGDPDQMLRMRKSPNRSKDGIESIKLSWSYLQSLQSLLFLVYSDFFHQVKNHLSEKFSTTEFGPDFTHLNPIT